MFSACMLCHGELYLLRPAAQHLTTFYLMVSIGGALGGIFVSLVAPLHLQRLLGVLCWAGNDDCHSADRFAQIKPKTSLPARVLYSLCLCW